MIFAFLGLKQIAMKIAKCPAILVCYAPCYRDWPKYRKLLKNACLRFIRATADPSLPTRARGQRSEQISGKLKFLIRYLGQSRREYVWFFLTTLPLPLLSRLKEGVSIPFHLPLFQKGKRSTNLVTESLYE